MANDKVNLYNGLELPQLGFGVFQITDAKQCEASVAAALEAGYRLVDTAACYGNEGAVGKAVQNSGLKRDDICLVSKVWIQDAGYEKTMVSFAKTLENLQTDYLDLYLVHMPYGDYHGSWRAMEELYRSGKVKAIGVCNFLPDRLADLILSHSIAPMVNQIELHPFCQQQKLLELMAKYKIQPMAWAPFAEGREGIFTHPVLQAIGNRYGKTPAQVVLRWLRQQGIIAIPKSVRPQRIQENFAIDDFNLSEDEMEQIAALDRGQSLILDVPSLDEVYRLHNIKFKQ